MQYLRLQQLNISALLHQQNGKTLLVTSKRHGIYPMLRAQLMANISIQCPKQGGTLFHNYKEFFSFVLLAICDARYSFTLLDVGHYGRNNDAGVLANSRFGKKNRSGGNEYSSTEAPRRLFV